MDPSRRARLRAHLRVIDAGVAPVMTKHAEHIQCGPGCSDCCHQTFRVSALEGAYLREGLASLTVAMAADIRQRALIYDADTRTPCPVLSDEGTCRLYEYRPRICRKYGIPLWHPDRPHEVRCCPKNFQDVGDIDATEILDPQAGWAEDWLTLRDELSLGPQEDRTIAAWLLYSDEAENVSQRSGSPESNPR